MRDDIGKRALTLVVVAAMVTSTFATAAVAAGVVSTDGAADLGGGMIAADVPGPVPGSSDDFAVRQGDRCTVVQPRGNGSQTVEEYYNYTINASQVGVLYGSVGTRDLHVNQTSQFFLYNGSDGVSLVLIHDAVNGTYGGTVEMSFTGLPENSTWAVEDDNYPNRDDRFAKNGSEANASWVWERNRNDGGVISGFNGSFEQVTIDPAFNRESSQFPYADWRAPNESNILTEWFYRTGDGGTETLDMNQSVTIEPGTCDDTGPEAALSVSTDNTSTAESVTFDASGSSDDQGLVEYQWDFDGDDEVDETTTDPTVTHTYNQSGEFEPAVAVYDAGRNADVATAGPIAVDAAAREVNGCEVIDSPGTYELAGDVSNTSTGTCIEITSGDVTFDGNGHTITDAGGDGRSVGVGVTSGTSNVTVRNVTVDGWTVGVETRGAENVMLSGVTTQGGTYGTFTVTSENVTIVDSVSGGASSIAFSQNQARNVTLVNDTAYGSQWGFHFEQESPNATLVNLTAYDNSKWDYYHYPRGYNGQIDHRVVNMTADDVSFGFTGGYGATFSGADWPTPPEAAGDNIGGYLQYAPVADDPILDSLTLSYDAAAVENESSVTMWMYTWNREGGSRGAGEWQQLDDATVDTSANEVTATGLQPQGYEEGHVFALFGTSDIGQAPIAAIDAPANATVNETATFSAANSTDDGSIESYEWAFGDGANATGETVEHAYAEPGNYNVTLTVTDDAGNTDTTNRTIEVTVPTTPPAAAFTVDSSATAGENVTFDASESSDENEIREYRWDFDGDGEIDAVTADPVIDHAFETTGDVEVTLTVVDETGATTTATRTVTVTDEEAPTAAVNAPSDVTAGSDAVFSAVNSTDNAEITGYEWTFGDGATANGAVVQHAYETTGSYEVTLTVTDAAGNTDSATTTVDVTAADANATAPTAELDVPESAPVGESVTLNASGDGGIAEYRWDFDGDGEVDETTTNATVEHTFGTAGTTTVVVTVVDANGSTASALGAIEITEDEAPVVVIDGPSTVNTGETLSLSGANSTDDGSIESYEWQLGNGETATGETVDVSYDDAGNYTVTLTVTDGAGNNATGSLNVTVEAAAGGDNGGNGGNDGGGGGAGGNNGGDDDDDGGNDNGGSGANNGGGGGGGSGDDDNDGDSGGSDGSDGGSGSNGDGGDGGSDGGDSGSDDEETETPTSTPETQPADISVTALEANRTTVGTGQAIEFTATVENAGDESGNYTVELELFGETVAEQTVELAGGETTTVSFVQSIDATGSYTARAGDQSVEVTVQSAASGGTGTATQTNTSTPGFGPVAVLLALIALAGLAVGRRRTDE